MAVAVAVACPPAIALVPVAVAVVVAVSSAAAVVALVFLLPVEVWAMVRVCFLKEKDKVVSIVGAEEACGFSTRIH